MKKILIMIILVVCSININFAQKGFYKFINTNTNNVTYLFSEYIEYKFDNKTLSILPFPVFNKLELDAIYVKTENFENCNDGDILQIILNDKSKIVISQSNEKNCNGEAMFELSETNKLKLYSTPIIAIHYMSGVSGDPIVVKLKVSDMYLFTDFYYYGITHPQILDVIYE